MTARLRTASLLVGLLLACDGSPAQPTTPTKATAPAQTGASGPAAELEKVCAAFTTSTEPNPTLRGVRVAQQLEKELRDPKVIGLVGTLAVVDPAHAFTVLKNGAAEIGVPDFSCPALEAAEATAKAAPPAPPPLTGEPLSFTVDGRTHRAAVALATRFNKERRVIVSSEPMTCAELLTVPEIFKKGRVSFIFSLPWTTGKHPLDRAEVLVDDSKKVTNLGASGGAVELRASEELVGARGTVKVEFQSAAPAASAAGVIDVELCE